VFAVEPVRHDVGDEKLAAVRVWSRVCHRQRACLVLVRVALELVGKLITRSAASAGGRITALDHEIGNNPMKDGPVIKLVPGQEDKIIDCVWRILGEEFADNFAARSIEHRGVLFVLIDRERWRSRILFRHLTTLAGPRKLTNAPGDWLSPGAPLALAGRFGVSCLLVKGIPGTLQEGGAAFATTHWSIVAACASDTEGAEIAVGRLCRDYWPPLYTFARRRGYIPADAQDLVQGFFAFLLQSKAYAQTDRTKGKFRSFLLTAFKNYMADAWDRGQALKRGAGYVFVLLDEEIDSVERIYGLEAATILNEDQQYERSWATALVARALERIRAELESGDKVNVFRALKPFLTGGAELPSQELVAQQLDMPIDTLRSHLSRLRARYRILIREEVARTIGPADDVDEELRHLRTILTAAC